MIQKMRVYIYNDILSSFIFLAQIENSIIMISCHKNKKKYTNTCQWGPKYVNNKTNMITSGCLRERERERGPLH